MTDLCVRVVHPDLETSVPVWGDGTGGWQPPAIEWACTLAGAGVPFVAGPDRSFDDGAGLLLLPDPDVVDVPVDAGRPLLTGPPPPSVPARLDAVADALGALVVPDLRGVLVLRLDDPGACVKRHLRSWRHPDVAPAAWAALREALTGGDRRGRMSIFCCPGWVDDEGSVVASREASPSEWQSLDTAVLAGWADLECHGYTHVDPATDEWLAAPDRFTNPAWYRELWPPGRPREPSVREQAAILRRWLERCGRATTLVAPGEAWGLNTMAAARREGFALFNSWGVCRLDLPHSTWCCGGGSPYLDCPGPEHLGSGLPAVGYWHDRDMALNGPSWAPDHLDAWRDCGARRLVAFADLAAAYRTPVAASLVGGEVRVGQAPDGWPLRIITAR